MANYNHAFTIAFEVKNSNRPDGTDVTPRQIRQALLTHLAEIDDNDLMAGVGAPFDTYEDELPPEESKDTMIRFECGQEDRISDTYYLDFVQFTYADEVRTIKGYEEVLVAYFGKDGMWHNEFDGQAYSDIIIG